MKINNKFDINDIVYHITPESQKGIIIDWRYNRLGNYILYNISAGFGTDFWCLENELSTEKQIL